MLRIWKTAFILFLTSSVFGQNLVPNPSFEEYNFCSTFNDGAGKPNHWFTPIGGLTPDYFNSCSEVSGLSVPQNFTGYQEARSGNAYIGLWAFSPDYVNSREFVSTQLLQPMLAGNKYVLTVYFNMANVSMYRVAELGVSFSVESPIAPDSIFQTELKVFNHDGELFNDTSNWVLFQDTITSNGGEEFITVGCVEPDIDLDTAFVPGENPNFDYSYYLVDDVSLIPLDSLLSAEAIERTSFNLYPNPATETVQIQLEQSGEAEVLVTDVLGREVYNEIPRSTRNDKIELNVSSWPNGIYLVSVINQKGIRSTQRLVVQH